jgi:alkylated DNA repair dioxygenase AlkB
MNKDLWNELWESGTDYEPNTGETTPKIPANCYAVTEYQLRNEIKSIDNKLYSEYYESDLENLLEDIEDNPHGEFLLFGLYHDYAVADSKDSSGWGSCKVFEYKNEDIYLIVHNDKKFMFHGYDITIISLYDDSHILFVGNEEITNFTR